MSPGPARSVEDGFDDISDLAVSYSSKNPPRPVRNSGRVRLLAENLRAKRMRSAAAAKGRPTRGAYHRPRPRKKELKVECGCIHDVSLPKLPRYLRAARVYGDRSRCNISQLSLTVLAVRSCQL